jgi:AP-2 complex subunit sigma-1
VCRAARRRTSQVYKILDEFFLAGEVQETSKQAILHRVQELDKLE